MKKEELFEALADIDEASVREAREYTVKKKPVWVRWTALAACAAVVLLAVFGIPLLKKAGSPAAGELTSGVITVKAAYAEAIAEGMDAEQFMEGDTHWNWWKDYVEVFLSSEEINEDLSAYYSTMMEKLLAAEDENTVCSPLNTYFAFAMLAETADGNTRQQILDMLKVPDLETLRKNVSALLASNQVDTPILKSHLANSLWLSNSMNYEEDTLNRLAEQYCASSFRGTPGSEEMNEALRAWTDENTGELLKDYTKDMTLSKDLVMDIVSAIYYKAQWTDRFFPENNTQETFRGTKSDTTAEMMHRSDMMSAYVTDAFTAVGLSLKDSGTMYFYLPNEGTDVNALLTDPDVLKATMETEIDDPNRLYPLVHLTIPKFKVSAKTDLREILPELGITDAPDPERADFTPLTRDRDDIYLAKAEHAAMIEIDEEGVTGAAYTELELDGAGAIMNELDFVLDRPFMFVLTGRDGSVLFSGVIRNLD